MCPQCEDLAQKTNFQESAAHLDLIFQLGGLVAAGSLRPLKGPTYPGSSDSGNAAIHIVVDIFECTTCRGRFRLIASSCNGVGAMWELDVKNGSSQLH
jgi:hypothetical protein